MRNGHSNERVSASPRSFMRGPRPLSRPFSHWNSQHDCGAARGGSNLDVATGSARPFPHAAQAMAVMVPEDVESPAIVGDFQIEPPAFDLKIDRDLGCAGVTKHVVNRLFEDEEDLPPNVGSHLQVLLPGRSLERE